MPTPPVSPDLEARYVTTLAKLEKLKRTAYLPKTTQRAPTFSADNKMGGYPYLRHAEDWPICPNCSRHLQLFLQLDQATLPTEKGDGLVQLFYCTSTDPLCEVDLQAFFPGSEAVSCRVIKVGGPSHSIEPNLQELYPEKLITGWQAVDDYPSNEERAELLGDFEIDDDVSDLLHEREVADTIQHDKLVGWPFWVQGIEYPIDPKSRVANTSFFQIDSEGNLPHMFGDAGIGHLTRDPSEPDSFSFGWACY